MSTDYEQLLAAYDRLVEQHGFHEVVYPLGILYAAKPEYRCPGCSGVIQVAHSPERGLAVVHVKPECQHYVNAGDVRETLGDENFEKITRPSAVGEA